MSYCTDRSLGIPLSGIKKQYKIKKNETIENFISVTADVEQYASWLCAKPK
ncbi:hypothetical protein D3C73_1476130 [compost metagenome]